MPSTLGPITVTSIILVMVFIHSGAAAFYPATSSEITYSGRHYLQNQTVHYDWPCFRIAFCFKSATKVQWKGKDTWNYYGVIIDGNITTKVKPGRSNSVTIFQSSNPESHCLQMVKITQNHYGPIASHIDSVFKGVQITGGPLFKRQEHFDYHFDFLGDSITTAFGVLSGTNPSCFFRMKKIQSCLYSWATHISKAFNADYRIMAVSGKGVLHNSYGVTGPKITSLYTRTTDNSKPFSYNYQDKVIPDVIFFMIGANDYSHPIKPNPNNFIFAYKTMLQTVLRELRQAAPQAKPLLINVCAAEMGREHQYTVQTAVNEFRSAYKLTHYVQIPKGVLSNLGCIGHPNVKGQRLIAQTLYPQVKKILEEQSLSLQG